jgi:hypothetical protein
VTRKEAEPGFSPPSYHGCFSPKTYCNLLFGFEHMKEGAEDDLAEIGGITGNTSEDREMILSLQKQNSEANLAREQQVHEIARLKASISKQEESMKVDMNKSLSGQINIRADNFEYDEDYDTLRVLDAMALDRELELHCTALDKDKKRKQAGAELCQAQFKLD